MKVFGYYDGSPDADPRQSGLVRTWDKSWTDNGWTTRLITAQHAENSVLFHKWISRSYYPMLALHKMGGGWLCPTFHVVNTGFGTDRFRGRANLSIDGKVYHLTRAKIEEVLKASKSKSKLPSVKIPEGELAIVQNEDEALAIIKALKVK